MLICESVIVFLHWNSHASVAPTLSHESLIGAHSEI